MARPAKPPRPRPGPSRYLLVLAGPLALLAACTGEEAVPIDPANPPTVPTTTVDLTDVTHSLQPTDEMREMAEDQCRDDPTLSEGYVRAVDPNTDEVLAEITVDCDEVRSGG